MSVPWTKLFTLVATINKVSLVKSKPVRLSCPVSLSFPLTATLEESLEVPTTALITTVSIPAPVLIASFPAPPVIVSAPDPPVIISAPAVPITFMPVVTPVKLIVEEEPVLELPERSILVKPERLESLLMIIECVLAVESSADSRTSTPVAPANELPEAIDIGPLITTRSVPFPPSILSTTAPLVINSALVANMKVSSPSPPLKRSMPAPPFNVSLPVLPINTSLPSPPLKLSSPAPPLIVSAFAPPIIVSAPLVPVTSKTVAACAAASLAKAASAPLLVTSNPNSKVVPVLSKSTK